MHFYKIGSRINHCSRFAGRTGLCLTDGETKWYKEMSIRASSEAPLFYVLK